MLGNITLQKLLYIKIVTLLPLKLLMPSLMLPQYNYRLAGIFTLIAIVCKAYRHAKYISTGGLGACPQEILKISPSEIESEGIFSNLSTFDVPVDTGTENFLICIICMPIHAG